MSIGRDSPGLPACEPHRRLAMAMLAGVPQRWLPGEPTHWGSGVSWESFLAQTDERVKPYLHWVCQRAPFDALVPPAVKDALAREHRRVAVRTLRWRSELRTILEACELRDLPLMLVKGSVLQRTVYPDPATRPMGDIDLLVRREDLARLNDAMKDLGFAARAPIESHTPMPGLEPDEESYFVKRIGANVLLVEIHTRLDFGEPELRVSNAPLWSLAERVEGSDGFALDTLEPNAALRHLCIHLGQHHGFDRGLLWLLDVRLFLDRYGGRIDWDRFARECSPRSLPYVALALVLASDWLGAEIPESVHRAFPAQHREAAVRLAWDQMWDFVHTRRPPGSLVLLGMSRDWRRIASYLRGRWRRWTLPVPGRRTPRLVLAGKRAWTELRTYRAAAREGGFAWSSLRTAHRAERRAARLESLLSETPAGAKASRDA